MPDVVSHGVKGTQVTLDYGHSFFLPNSLAEKNAFVKQARANGNSHLVAIAEEQWIDLRYAYSQTINKSQGSTYDKVFIDLDDIKKVNSGDVLARMMYVAVSRARHTVILTGDFIN